MKGGGVERGEEWRGGVGREGGVERGGEVGGGGGER